jgi:hypothetical protein
MNTAPDSTLLLREAFNQRGYLHAIMALITHRRLPFSAIEWPELRNLCLSCNPAIDDMLYRSRSTMMRRIEDTFHAYQAQLRTLLRISLSQIHLSTDLWTSPHRRSVLAICARWVDPHQGLMKALLGLRECPLDHSGAAQAQHINDVIDEYGISHVGYFTGDNATSNDTCVVSLIKLLENRCQSGNSAEVRRVPSIRALS